jgi:hypothetical protein
MNLPHYITFKTLGIEKKGRIFKAARENPQWPS